MHRPIFSIVGLGCTALLASTALAEGDPTAGERAFRQCGACHTLDGSHRVGPTLQGIFGRTAGAAEGFRYSPDVVALGEAGVIWEDENLIVYLDNPTEFIKQTLGKDRAQTRMPNRYPDQQMRRDIVAYLKAAAGG